MGVIGCWFSGAKDCCSLVCDCFDSGSGSGGGTKIEDEDAGKFAVSSELGKRVLSALAIGLHAFSSNGLS